MNPNVEEVSSDIPKKLKHLTGFFLISLTISVLFTKLYIIIFETEFYVPQLLDIINPFYGALIMIFSLLTYFIIYVGAILILFQTIRKSLLVNLIVHLLKFYALIMPFLVLDFQIMFGGMLYKELYHPYVLFFLSSSLLLFSGYMMIYKVGQYIGKTLDIKIPYLKVSIALMLVWGIGSNISFPFTSKVINKRALYEIAQNVINEKVEDQLITQEMATKQLMYLKKELKNM